MNSFLEIRKSEWQPDGSIIIHGLASTPQLDADGEIVSPDAMKAALPDFLRWSNVREQHDPTRAVGTVLEARVLDSGETWIKAKIIDRSAISKILGGVLRGFSIGGKALAKLGNTITRLLLTEISLVDRPANSQCTFEIAKMQKGDESRAMEHMIREWSPAERQKCCRTAKERSIQTLNTIMKANL